MLLVKKSLKGLFFAPVFAIPFSLLLVLMWIFIAFLDNSHVDFLSTFRWTYIAYVGIMWAANIASTVWGVTVCLIYAHKWHLPFRTVEEGIVRYHVLKRGWSKWTSDEFTQRLQDVLDARATRAALKDLGSFARR